MAIRLRQVDKNQWIALCAASSSAAEGDIYLDDSHHIALGQKFARDFNSMWDTDLPYNQKELDCLIDAIEKENKQ